MGDSHPPRWLLWARELQAVSQTGLHFTKDPYDRIRYQRLAEIAGEIMAVHSNLPVADFLRFHSQETGYATPKVDVRGAVFRGDEVLLVREVLDAGRWTLPGGWADVNETPSQAVIREVREESGYEVRVLKLAAVYDRDKQRHEPALRWHVYKLFFVCEIVGGAPAANLEASEVAFFPVDRLPELSIARVMPGQILRMREHYLNPGLATDYD